jgi:hypothetical protein
MGEFGLIARSSSIATSAPPKLCDSSSIRADNAIASASFGLPSAACASSFFARSLSSCDRKYAAAATWAVRNHGR